jgi:glyoxylase-like metal-dependent hydrolase (beta-lactamase superfamily II)
MARTLLLLLVIFHVVTAQNGASQISITEDLYYTKLTNRAFIITHKFPWKCNSIFIYSPDSTGILIDTPNENSGTHDLLSWISSTFGNLNLVAINTGFHNDNLGGNAVLIEHGITVYGSGLTYRLIQSRGERLKQQLLDFTATPDKGRYHESYRLTAFVPPTDTFNINNGIELEVGGDTLEVYYPGPSHTVDNVVVYIRQENILFGGCMILAQNRDKPGYIADADMQEWPESVEKVKERYGSAEWVVPGHGSAGNAHLLKHTIRVLRKWNNHH